MSRTLKGNLTGKAAQIERRERMFDNLSVPLSGREGRIAEKIAVLKQLMGDDFAEFYKTAPFAASMLEPVLDEKIEEIAILSAARAIAETMDERKRIARFIFDNADAIESEIDAQDEMSTRRDNEMAGYPV